VSLVFINGIRYNRRYWVILDQQQGGDMFCRIRGYLSSCKKQGIGASEAMRGVFEGEVVVFDDG